MKILNSKTNKLKNIYQKRKWQVLTDTFPVVFLIKISDFNEPCKDIFFLITYHLYSYTTIQF